MDAGPTNAPIAAAGIELEAIGATGYKFKGASADGMSLALLRAAPAGKSKALVEG